VTLDALYTLKSVAKCQILINRRKSVFCFFWK